MEYTRFRILKLALASEIALLVTALFCVRYFRIDVPPFTENVLRDFFISAVGSVPPLILFLFMVSKRAGGFSPLKGIRKIVFIDIRNIFARSGLIDLVLISLAAGIAEELLFRGVLQSQFGIVVSSILFGLVHFISPLYMIIAAAMGFYLGALLSVYHSMMVPVLIHFFYDLGALVYLCFFMDEMNENNPN